MRKMNFRMVGQHDTHEDEGYLSVLFGYVYRPGTVFYIGLGGDYVYENGSFRRSSRNAFIKASYLWRM